MLWKTLTLSAIVGAAALTFGSTPSSAEAGVVVRGSNGGFVAVRGPGYRWSRGYGYGGYGYGYPSYAYSYPAYSYGYSYAPTYYSQPYYSTYSYPTYYGGYGYGGYPYYGGARGAFVGPNGAAFYGPRGGFRIRY